MSITAANPESINLQYDNLIEKLKTEIKEAKSDEERVKIYIEFLENYMMPKQFWLDLLKLSNKQDEVYLTCTIHPIYIKLINMSPYYFMYTSQGAINGDYHLKIYDINRTYTAVSPSSNSIIEEYLKKHGIDLMFPHKELKQFLIIYEKDRFSPIPSNFIKNVKKMEELYRKIKSSEADTELWFKYVKEANDTEYVKQNVEDLLLKNLSNQKLWKIYIEYLRETDPKEMLQVYSKYCRCFLDDAEMKEKYKNEMKIHGPVFVKWKNPFDFEDSVERCVTPDAKEHFHSLSSKSKLKAPVFVCPKVDFKNTYSQDWSLPKPIIRYIASEVHSQTSEKLLQTCKYFLKLNSMLYCYKAAFVASTFFGNYEIKESSFLISIASMNLPPFNKKNLYISNVLIFHDWKNSFINSPYNTNLKAAIKTHIFQCDAKFIDIQHQKLTKMELQFLVGHGNVKYLVLDDIHNFEKDVENEEEEMAVEEILEMTPKLQHFSINNRNLKISNTFSKLNFTQKFIYFCIQSSSIAIDCNDYCTFLKKYAAPFSKFYACHGYNINENVRKEFDEAVSSFVKDWNPADERPKVLLGRE